MEFNFAAALEEIGQAGLVRIANDARPPGVYLFEDVLPERLMPVYHVENASMVVRPTMAGLVGMDSPYPAGGAMEMSSFMEETAKLANEVGLTEKAIRTIQGIIQQLRDTETSVTDRLVDEMLNFYNLVIIQPHLDAMEWLRGQALCRGRIDWNFNGKELAVDYLLPPGNHNAIRVGNDAYHGSTSKFWDDIRFIRRTLRNNLRVIIAHPDTIEGARYNLFNQMGVVAEGPNTITFRRYMRNEAGNMLPGQFSSEASDVVTVITYDREGEVLNPADPSTTLKLPFMQRGMLLGIGNNQETGYVPGRGAQEEDPDDGNTLGYTHLAPTVENGGRPGRWGEMYVPQNAPWALRGRAVTNGLPVINAGAEHKLATTRTEMPA